MATEVDQTFRALADPNRRAMVERLSRGPAPLSELARPLSITLSAAGQHVKVLEATGLVETSKAGRVRTCRMRAPGLSPLEGWVAARRTEWERRLDRLGDVIDQDQPLPVTVAHDRFEVRREYPAAVNLVFANWADPELKRRWFSEPGNHYESDFRVGGAEINRGVSPAGTSIAYLGRYSDIVTDERIVYTYDLFAEDALLSASLVSVEFAPISTGTALTLVEHLVLLDQRDRAEYRQAGVTTQLDRLTVSLTR